MARQVSLTALQAMLAQNTEQVFLHFLEITHPDLVTPLRVVDDLVAHTRGGHSYVAFPFTIDLPKDSEEGIESVTLVIACVDQQIPSIIRSLPTAFDVSLTIALAATPDTAEAGPFVFTSVACEFVGLQGTITLGFYQNLLNQPFPGDTFAPYNADPTR